MNRFKNAKGQDLSKWRAFISHYVFYLTGNEFVQKSVFPVGD